MSFRVVALGMLLSSVAWGGEPMPQDCGLTTETAQFGGVQVGSIVMIGRHRFVEGRDGWSYYLNESVGLPAKVTRLDGVDVSGCPVVLVDIDNSSAKFRVRDLSWPEDERWMPAKTALRVYGQVKPKSKFASLRFGTWSTFIAGDAESYVPGYSGLLSEAVSLVGRGHPAVAGLLMRLGEGYKKQNKGDMSVEAYRDALDILTKVYGADSPFLVDTMNELAQAEFDAGHMASAEQMFQASYDLVVRVLGPDHPKITRGARGLAEIAERRGDGETAAGLLERGLIALQTSLGARDATVADQLIAMSRFELDRGNLDRALAHAELAVDIAREAKTAKSYEYANALDARGDVLLKAGRAGEAVDAYGEMLDVRRAIRGGAEAWHCWGVGQLGDAFFANGQLADAEAAYRDALKLARSAPVVDRKLESYFLRHLGVMLTAAGRKAEAVAALTQSEQIAVPAYGATSAEVAAIRRDKAAAEALR